MKSADPEVIEVEPSPAPPGAPNLLVVMTDDQDFRSLSAVPFVERAIGGQGTTFSRSFVSYALCCPSRATFFTGAYAHSHGVLGNKAKLDGGGYENLADPSRVLPAWLNAGGYTTTHVGKYIHGYDKRASPPGWDRFWGFLGEQGAQYEYVLRGPGTETQERGTRNRDFATDLTTRIAVRELKRSASGRKPFFLSVGYTAPHAAEVRARDAGGPCAPEAGEGDFAQPSPSDLDKVGEIPIPSPSGAFDEVDVSDKPPRVERRTRLDQDDIQFVRRRRACQVASLLAVDRGVKDMISTLRATGELNDTVVLFTSDNGLFYGEHRITGDKNQPYEEAIRVPLMMRGPGVPAGRVIDDPVINADLAPTLLDLAGVSQPKAIERPSDGRSLVGLLEGDARWASRMLLIEGRSNGVKTSSGAQVASYQGVRSRRYMYSEYYLQPVESVASGLDTAPGTGELLFTELYDLERDPFQLENVADSERYERAKAVLDASLRVLSDCKGRSCLLRRIVPGPAKPNR